MQHCSISVTQIYTDDNHLHQSPYLTLPYDTGQVCVSNYVEFISYLR